MSRPKSGIFNGRICRLDDPRCLKGCNAIGSAFAGTGGHARGCPVAVDWARQRIAAGTPYPGDAAMIAKAAQEMP